MHAPEEAIVAGASHEHIEAIISEEAAGRFFRSTFMLEYLRIFVDSLRTEEDIVTVASFDNVVTSSRTHDVVTAQTQDDVVSTAGEVDGSRSSLLSGSGVAWRSQPTIVTASTARIRRTGDHRGGLAPLRARPRRILEGIGSA